MSGSPVSDDPLSRLNPVNRVLTELDIDSILSRYRVNYRCLDATPFVVATTHRSYRSSSASADNTGQGKCVPLQPNDYERLEHLGDSVVELIVTDYLHERYPRENEGFLSKLRVKIVSGVFLGKLGHAVGLNRWVLLSAQSEASRNSQCIAEDVLEAFCGALFKAAGYEVARAWLVNVIEEHLDIAEVISHLRCSKDRLVQLCMRTLGFRPTIKIHKDPAFDKTCCTAVVTDDHDNVIGQAVAATAKEAEIEACLDAWDRLNK